MKKLFVLFVAAILAVSCSNEPKYILSGELEGITEGQVFLQKRESGEMVKLDSAIIENGIFEIIGGAVDYPEMYYLMVEGNTGYKMLFVENQKISLNGHVDSLFDASVEGSVTNSEYDSFNKGLEPYYDKNSEIYQKVKAAREAGDEEMADELNKQREVIFDEIKEYQMSFIKSNPGSYASPTILRSVIYGMGGEELESHINELEPEIRETKLIMDLIDRVEVLKAVAIGEIAPDFTQNDQDGNPITLSEVVGPKLLLLDFWAAWCGPCRRENPNIVAVYKEFNDKGFDVFGVSLDRDKEDWLKAIEEDNLTWKHVSDLQYWSNAAAKMYAVNSIPANFLLDEEGRILATNIRGDELREKVVEILGE